MNVKIAGAYDEKRVRAPETDPLVSGAHGDLRVFDAQAVVDVKPVLRGVYADRAAGDDELVVDVKAVPAARGNAETAAAVDGEIVMAEDHAAAFVGDGRLAVFLAAGKAVLRARRQGQKDLVRLVDADARVVRAADLRSVQQDPYLGAVFGADDDAAVRERAGEHIAPRLRDDHVAVVGIGPAAVYRGAVAGEDDARRAGAVPVAGAVVARKPGGVAAVLGIPVHDGRESETLPVHEQQREQDGADKDGNADKVDMLMR